MKRNIKKQSGFVLLMTSIVISAILVAIVFSLSFSGFFTRFNLLDSYNKESSLALAEACGSIAVLKRVQDSSYAGNETLAIGPESCNIMPLENSGPEIVIKTSAVKGGAVSNIAVNIDSSTLDVVRWREVASF